MQETDAFRNEAFTKRGRDIEERERER